ncbi:MAG TPA: carboxypeptidase-like regulatory domain-containing protein, partial [Rhodothermales bacterium]|nr:carboxypeptidase-like regulatory domain-containing protein [Rhodothermales bacterium]
MLVLLCGATDAWAQLATVRGRVTDANKAESLPGAAVVLRNLDDGTQTGTATDGNGYFILSRIAPGTYTLTASFVGFIAQTDTLTLDFNASHSVEL